MSTQSQHADALPGERARLPPHLPGQRVVDLIEIVEAFVRICVLTLF
jgi:hypothetical protein